MTLYLFDVVLPSVHITNIQDSDHDIITALCYLSAKRDDCRDFFLKKKILLNQTIYHQ